MNIGTVYRSLAEALQSPQDVVILEIENYGADKATHPMPPEIATLTNLERLSIACSLPAFLAIPDAIGRLKKLRSLEISQSPVTHISPQISALRALERLYLGCAVSELPDEITALDRLEELGIGSRPLSSLPESIGRLKNLRKLVVYGDRITRLPASLGNLPNLSSVTLGVDGLLDPEQAADVLSRLPNLRYLDLAFGSFATLPVKLGECRALEFLDVSGNRYLQHVPDGMKPLESWNTVRVHKSCTAFKKALKKLLPDGRLVTKWTQEGLAGGVQEYSNVQRYVRKGAELIWDGARVTTLS